MQAKHVLHSLLGRVCGGRHKVRRASRFAGVMAALRGEVLTAACLGRAITSQAKAKHCIKRADRLLSNSHLHGERVDIHKALTQECLGSKQRPAALVDWSARDESGRHFLLRASVPLGGRSLTLYEEVHTPKRKDKPSVHKRFLCACQKMLPPTCRPLIVTRAGFSDSLVQAGRSARLGLDRAHPQPP